MIANFSLDGSSDNIQAAKEFGKPASAAESVYMLEVEPTEKTADG